MSAAKVVEAIFEAMPAGFVAERAGDWRAVLQWEIAGSGEFTLVVDEHGLSTHKGKQGEPTCVIKTDTETFLGIVQGKADPQRAFAEGRFSANNLGDLMKYQMAIDGKRVRAAVEAASAGKPIGGTGAASPQAEGEDPKVTAERLARLTPIERLRVLLWLLPHRAVATDETRNLRLTIDGEAVTVAQQGGELAVRWQHEGQPTSRVKATAEALWRLFCGGGGAELFARAEITATSMDELRWVLAAAGGEVERAVASELKARGPRINPEAVGREVAGAVQPVSAEQLRAFAAATNEGNPRFVDADHPEGLRGAPLFPVAFFNQVFMQVVTDPTIGFDLARLVFGEMDLTFVAPVRPGQKVQARCALSGVDDKEGGQVGRVSCRLEADGELCCEGVASIFVRWAGSTVPRQKKGARALREGDVVLETSLPIDADQPERFAPVANDPNPIHLDEVFARSVGLPGRVLHGMCSMAFCGRALVDGICDGDDARLRRLACRFAKPALPGQTLTVRVFTPEDNDDKTRTYPFVAVNDEGSPVITEGQAVIAIS